MRALFRGCLFSAADYDSCAGRDHGASVGNLLAGCAIADDLDFEASAAACSMTLRTGRPMSEGTRKCVASGTVTVFVAGCVEASNAEVVACGTAGWPFAGLALAAELAA